MDNFESYDKRIAKVFDYFDTPYRERVKLTPGVFACLQAQDAMHIEYCVNEYGGWEVRIDDLNVFGVRKLIVKSQAFGVDDKALGEPKITNSFEVSVTLDGKLDTSRCGSLRDAAIFASERIAVFYDNNDEDDEVEEEDY